MQQLATRANVTSISHLQTLSDEAAKTMERASAEMQVALPAPAPEPVVNDRFLPSGPASVTPVPLTEQRVWQILDEEAQHKAKVQEEDRKDLAVALALDAKRQPEELHPKSGKSDSLEVNRLGFSTKVAALRSMIDRAAADLKAEATEYTEYASKSFAHEAASPEVKEKWEYDCGVVSKAVASFQEFAKQQADPLQELLSQAKQCTASTFLELEEKLKLQEKEAKDQISQNKKTISRFGSSITKQEKADSKATSKSISSPKDIEMPAPDKMSNLEALFFNARMQDSLKHGINLGSEISSVAPYRTKVPGQDTLDSLIKEPSIKSALKALENHMAQTSKAFSNIILTNHAKTFQAVATLQLSQGALAKKVFPPSAQAWCKAVYSTQLYKASKSYDYLGLLPFAIGETRVLLKGKEWLAGVPYERLQGDSYQEKKDWVASAKPGA